MYELDCTLGARIAPDASSYKQKRPFFYHNRPHTVHRCVMLFIFHMVDPAIHDGRGSGRIAP